MPLQRQSTFKDPDDVYATLVDAHRGLTFEASAALNARLVLLLANHIGDPDVIREALEIARSAGPQSPST